MNSSLKEFTDYVTIMSNLSLGGGGGIVILLHHSVPYKVPDGDILSNDAMAKVLAVQVELAGREGIPSMTWSTLGFDHLPITISLSSHTQPPECSAWHLFPNTGDSILA